MASIQMYTRPVNSRVCVGLCGCGCVYVLCGPQHKRHILGILDLMFQKESVSSPPIPADFSKSTIVALS